MPASPSRRARRARTLLAAAAAFATLAAVLVVPAPAAEAALPTQVRWLGGKDLYETSALMSQRLLGSREAVGITVYLTSGESGGHSLAIPPAAVNDQMTTAHVLMVRRTSIPAAVEAQLRRLNPRSVVVVGDAGTISDAVLTRARAVLGSRASVWRMGGDRVATALELASRVSTPYGVREAFVIGQNGYSDGLVAGTIGARIAAPIIPAMGDPARWAARVAPTLSKLEAVYFVGGRSVLPDSYLRALDARIAAPIERIAGSDRYRTNAMLVERFVPGVSADHLYLVAGNGHGDTIGASVLAAAEDSIMMLSGRTCHDHTAVPRQIDRLSVTRVVGVGTKFWITEPALRSNVCGAGYFGGAQPTPVEGALQLTEGPSGGSANPVPYGAVAAGQRFGTFRGMTASGGAGEHLYVLPPTVAMALVTARTSGPGAAVDVMALDASLQPLSHVVGGSSGQWGWYRGEGLLDNEVREAAYLLVTANDPWTLSVDDTTHIWNLEVTANRVTDEGDRVGFWSGPSTTVSTRIQAQEMLVEQLSLWDGWRTMIDGTAGQTRSSWVSSPPLIVVVTTHGSEQRFALDFAPR